MRGTGRPTQLPGRVRKESTTWGAFKGFEPHLCGVMAVSGGGPTTTPPTWCWKPISASKAVIFARSRPGNLMGRPEMGGIQDWRAFLRLPERSQVWQPEKLVLCPTRPPKRPRGGVVACKVVVSAYRRRENLIGRPVMGGIKDSRARARLSDRSQVRQPPKRVLCPKRPPKRPPERLWARQPRRSRPPPHGHGHCTGMNDDGQKPRRTGTMANKNHGEQDLPWARNPHGHEPPAGTELPWAETPAGLGYHGQNWLCFWATMG